MTVLMFQKRFVTPIQAGTKSQTIRPVRKRPLKVGELLSLRHWEDKAYRSPQIEFFKATCLGTLDIQVHAAGILLGDGNFDGTFSVPYLNAFAAGDGFANWAEMKEFFESRFGYGLPFIGTLIQWEAAK